MLLTSSDATASDRQLQQYLRRTAAHGRTTEQVGPFWATFDPDDPLTHLNYAIPDDGARPSPEDVAALIAASERRSRRARVEFLPAVAPGVEPALLAGGFTLEARLPVMTATAATLVEPKPVAGIELGRPASEADVRGLLSAQLAAFGEPPPDDAALARAVASRDDGAVRVLARDRATGEVVGGGMATAPSDGVSEIAGIGVAEEHRRRGIAAAVTAWLARELFAADVALAFLTPGDEGAQRVYARAGFTVTSEMVHLSVP